MADEDPWLTLSEAAQRSGLAREAIRTRARRGQITSRKGNRGELHGAAAGRHADRV